MSWRYKNKESVFLLYKDAQVYYEKPGALCMKQENNTTNFKNTCINGTLPRIRDRGVPVMHISECQANPCFSRV